MWIFHNWLYKLAALVIAAVLWAAIQGVRSEQEGIDLPVALEHVPKGVVVVEQTPSEINLRIVGSRAALRRATRQLVRYPISLEGVKPGEARFAVEASRLPVPRGARVAARSPSTIVLRIEKRVEKRVPIRADVVGNPAPEFVVRSVEIEPRQVRLSGARSALRRIREVSTDRVDVTGLAAPSVREVRILLQEPNVWQVEPEGPIQVRLDVERVSAEGAGEPGASRGPAQKGRGA
ncbi:MAG: YbbR-like domain-containing protein [Myxococcota bacterium]